MRFFYCGLLAALITTTALAQAPRPRKPTTKPAGQARAASPLSEKDKEPWPYLPEDFNLWAEPRPALPSPADSVYTYTEQMPRLGERGTLSDLAKVLRRAVAAPPNAPAGRLFVRFEVTRQGRVSQLQIVKGLRADLDSAVAQAVRQLPRFVPGHHHGRAVPVSLTVPLTFEEAK